MWRNLANKSSGNFGNSSARTAFNITPDEDEDQMNYLFRRDFAKHNGRFVRLAVKEWDSKTSKRNLYIYMVLFKHEKDEQQWLRRSQIAFTIDEFSMLTGFVGDDNGELNTALMRILENTGPGPATTAPSNTVDKAPQYTGYPEMVGNRGKSPLLTSGLLVVSNEGRSPPLVYSSDDEIPLTQPTEIFSSDEDIRPAVLSGGKTPAKKRKPAHLPKKKLNHIV